MDKDAFRSFLRCGEYKSTDEFADGGYLVPKVMLVHKDMPVTGDNVDATFKAYLGHINAFMANCGMSIHVSEDLSIDYAGRRYDVWVEDGKFACGDTYLDMVSPSVEVDVAQQIIDAVKREEGGD